MVKFGVRPQTFFTGNILIRRQSSDNAENQQQQHSGVNGKLTFEVEKQLDLDRIREMQKYFEQYTEEYVEMEDEAEPVYNVTKTERLRQRLEPLLDLQTNVAARSFSVKEVIDILRAERAEDIVCIKVPCRGAPDKYVIICTPHNVRHGEAIVLAIRKCFKLKTDCQVESLKKAKVGRWLCYNFENISLHIMTREARFKYDLESLWGIGWEETLLGDEHDDLPSHFLALNDI